MEDNKQKWIYQTISIETIEEYISYVKQGYCVFDIKDADIPYFCEEFERLYNATKDNDFLYEYAVLLRKKSEKEESTDSVVLTTDLSN